MATVIDSLIVKLGLDNKDFKKGSKDAASDFERTKKTAQQTAKDVEMSGQKSANFFKELRKSALQFFAVFTLGQGIKNFTQNVISNGAQLDRMSKRVDESASNLSRWQGAVRQSGGTAEGFLATVQGISQQFTQLKETGDAPIRTLLTQLGVSAADASGRAKPILQLLRDIGDALESKQWASGDKFNKLMAAGIDEGTINLLMRGRAEREKLIASQKAYTDKEASAARKAEENWEKIKMQIERTTDDLLFKLLPTIEKAVGAIAKMATTLVPKLIEGFDALSNTTGKWFANIEKAYTFLDKISSIKDIFSGGSEQDKKAAQNEEELSKRAKSGDREAARQLAIKALTTGTNRKPSEEMIQKYSDAFMGAEGRRRAVGKVTDDSRNPAAAMIQAPGTPMSGVSAVSRPAPGGSTTISVGEVKVFTQATDANGIARDLKGAIVRQADGGMR